MSLSICCYVETLAMSIIAARMSRLGMYVADGRDPTEERIANRCASILASYFVQTTVMGTVMDRASTSSR